MIVFNIKYDNGLYLLSVKDYGYFVHNTLDALMRNLTDIIVELA